MKKTCNDATKQQNMKSNFAAFSFLGFFTLTQLLQYPYSYLMAIIPFLIVEGIVILFYLRKINKKYQQTNVVVEQNQTLPSPKAPKPNGISVTKVELVNDSLKFSATKGFIKKRLVVIKEIPVAEITGVEGFGNESTITSNDASDLFVLQRNGESFSGLRDQILALLEEQKKIRETNAKTQLRRSELSQVIKGSMSVVDLSFNMLMSLQLKKIDWTKLETYVNDLGQNLGFVVQTIPPLTLDFSKVADAVKSQVPQKASEEAFNVLKSIYGYFNELKLEEDLSTHPNFKDAKAVNLAYYTLNDILFGKLVGEKNNQKERLVLEATLQNLAKDTDFKVNFEDLVGSFDKISSDVDVKSVIEDCRETFKEQVKNIIHPYEQLSCVKSPKEQVIVLPELLQTPSHQKPVPPSEQALVQSPTLEPVVEQQVAMQMSTESNAVEHTASALPPKPPELMHHTNPHGLTIPFSAEPTVLEQQEPVQPPTEKPSVEQQDSPQAEVAPPNNEEIKNTLSPLPKKKSAGRRLRKAILGY